MELEQLRARFEKLEKERNDYKQTADRLETKVCKTYDLETKIQMSQSCQVKKYQKCIKYCLVQEGHNNRVPTTKLIRDDVCSAPNLAYFKKKLKSYLLTCKTSRRLHGVDLAMSME